MDCPCLCSSGVRDCTAYRRACGSLGRSASLTAVLMRATSVTSVAGLDPLAIGLVTVALSRKNMICSTTKNSMTAISTIDLTTRDRDRCLLDAATGEGEMALICCSNDAFELAAVWPWLIRLPELYSAEFCGPDAYA